MMKLPNINLTEMVGIKILCFISLAVAVFGDVVAAPRFIQTSGSNYIQQNFASSLNTRYIENEILVKFKSNVPEHVQQFTATNLGGRSFTPVGKELRVARITLQLGSDVATTVQAFNADANVEFSQPNYIYQATALPNDANFNQLWGMKNTGQIITNGSYPFNNPGTTGSDIDAESAWDEITDCRTVVVAVLDTGINYTHEDLAGNMWDGSASGFPNHGKDIIGDDNDPMPTGGGEDHGTHVAGTIGAVGSNNKGVAGVCWQASIMSVRVLGADGFGTTAGIILGIEFASDNGADVINMSLGAEIPFDLASSDAIDYARARDVVIVVSAGNDGSDNEGPGPDGDPDTKIYPCSFTQDNLICVAALDQSFSLASFSNYGATSVDVGAPGTNTLSSWAGQIITDDFSSRWTLNGGWSRFNNCFGFITLSNPANWCTGAEYSNGIDDTAYKTFDLSGATAAELSYFAAYETEADVDIFSGAMKSSGGDPFIGGTTLQSNSGSTYPFFIYFNHNITPCISLTCSLGFRLQTNGANVFNGVGIDTFTIETLQTNSTSYLSINGTSMASPHVAGIATMVRAFNPDYTYAQTVEAIKSGGQELAALSGITSTGRSANAMGAIAHITEPAGLAAVVQ